MAHILYDSKVSSKKRWDLFMWAEKLWNECDTSLEAIEDPEWVQCAGKTGC